MPQTAGNGNKLTMWILGVLFTIAGALGGLMYSDIKADATQNTKDIVDIKLYMQGGRTLDSLILVKLTEIEEKLGD